MGKKICVNFLAQCQRLLQGMFGHDGHDGRIQRDGTWADGVVSFFV